MSLYVHKGVLRSLLGKTLEAGRSDICLCPSAGYSMGRQNRLRNVIVLQCGAG